MPLRGLRTHALDTPDLAAARAWYTELLGVEPYFDQPFYVGFDVAGYELGMTPRSGAPDGSIPYWASDDVRADVARAVDMGATELEAPHEVGDAMVVGAVRDPFGNALGFIENRHFAPPVVAASGADLRDDPIVVEVHVAATPDACFAAWTSNEGIAAWWVPTARIELRIGGHFELLFAGDEPWGRRGSERCRILSYLPGRMLSFTWNAPPHLDRVHEEHTWVVVEFEPADDETLVRLTHTGWPASAWDSEPQWAETHAYFERAWASVLGMMQRHFEAT